MSVVTQRQLEANRRNAQRSCGPRTPAGKDLASRNATKHGLTAERVVVLTEDPAEYERLRAGIRASLQPVGEFERVLADRIAAASWRLGRAARAERELLEEGLKLRMRNHRTLNEDPLAPQPTLGEELASTFGRKGEPLEKFGRYEARIERGLFRAARELRLGRKGRREEGDGP